MILCIDTTALKTSKDVQKDLNLEDLLKNHTKYYESTECAYKDKYVPLDFCVSVRTTYTNKVLQNTTEEGKKLYYVNMSQVQEFPHKGYDLVMFLGSLALLNCVDYRAGFDDIMFKYSQFQVKGLYNLVPFVINPIVYSHIIISDEGYEEFKSFLKSDKVFVPISEMNDNKQGNIKALLKTLVEVEKEK